VTSDEQASANLLHRYAELIDAGDLEGADATVRSSFTVFQAAPGAPPQPVIIGRYHDRLRKADGEWYFVDRLILTDLVGDLSRHLQDAP
jgi:hypothetical protein